MNGMDRTTGKPISGDEHLVQSIGDILTTPLGTRPMRRDYGSMLPELLDKPLNPATRLLCAQATALALARWEPRVTVRQVRLEGDFTSGKATMSILAARLDQPSANALTRLSIPLKG